MKIQAVRIDGFKNLSDISLAFDSITALVSLNNFGKSNVLNGIDFGLSFIKASASDKKQMMSNASLIPFNKFLLNKNFKFEVESLTGDSEKKCRVRYGYEFTWRHNAEDSPQIVREFLKIKPDEKGGRFAQIINRTGDSAHYKSSKTGRCSSNVKVEPTELVVNKLCAFDGLYYIDIVRELNNMTFYMEDNLDARSFFWPDPVILRDFKDVMIDAKNLPRIIYQLQKNFPDKYELLKDVYTQLFPNIEDFIVKQFNIDEASSNKLPDDAPFAIMNSIYVLYVKDKNLSHPINFEMMSDGAKRVFMILTKIILSSTGNVSLIAIEEPENSVHPSLFHSYIQIISQLLDNCKIIITSHSPYIVSYLELSWIHVGKNRTPGVAEFFSFKNSKQKQLQQDAELFHMRMGDYIFSLLSDSDDSLDDYLECDANE